MRHRRQLRPSARRADGRGGREGLPARSTCQPPRPDRRHHARRGCRSARSPPRHGDDLQAAERDADAPRGSRGSDREDAHRTRSRSAGILAPLGLTRRIRRVMILIMVGGRASCAVAVDDGGGSDAAISAVTSLIDTALTRRRLLMAGGAAALAAIVGELPGAVTAVRGFGTPAHLLRSSYVPLIGAPFELTAPGRPRVVARLVSVRTSASAGACDRWPAPMTLLRCCSIARAARGSNRP